MKAYLKDQNGDAASIINGKIHGLFFGINVEGKTGHPPQMSNFEPRRLYVPAGNFMYPDTVRLYFADFYCNKESHYITLVMTEQGSSADLFCCENLISLNTRSNVFLYKGFADNGCSTVFVTSNVWVEILYTEDIDLNYWISEQGCFMDNVPSRGTSRPGGIPKKMPCDICNLPV